MEIAARPARRRAASVTRIFLGFAASHWPGDGINRRRRLKATAATLAASSGFESGQLLADEAALIHGQLVGAPLV